MELLAKKCELEAYFYPDEDRMAVVYKVFKRTGKKTVPAGMWPITYDKTASGEMVVASPEYLLLPARNIEGATDEDFQALLEGLPPVEEEP